MLPQTTKVPAAKKPIKSDSPLIAHGMFPPPPKNPLRSFPDFDREMPVASTATEKITTVIMSSMPISMCFFLLWAKIDVWML